MKLANEAYVKQKLYATGELEPGESNKLYGLVQCIREWQGCGIELIPFINLCFLFYISIYVPNLCIVTVEIVLHDLITM